MAGWLTGLDMGESAWVEREQPWEQRLPAVPETRQPKFMLKSKNHARLCRNPAWSWEKMNMCLQEEHGAGFLLQDGSPKTKIWAEILQWATQDLTPHPSMSAGVHLFKHSV